jgi:hypothetical protein
MRKSLDERLYHAVFFARYQDAAILTGTRPGSVLFPERRLSSRKRNLRVRSKMISAQRSNQSVIPALLNGGRLAFAVDKLKGKSSNVGTAGFSINWTGLNRESNQ